MKLVRTDGDQSITKMPAFNKTITIELELDHIYNRLLELFPADYKHREVLGHAIIGSALTNGGLVHICKALHGYTNDIDFKEGDVVICTEKDRVEWYDANKENEDGTAIKRPVLNDEENDYKVEWKPRYVAIGRCVVTKVNLYAASKLTVEYEGQSRHRRDEPSAKETVVHHQNCTKVAQDV